MAFLKNTFSKVLQFKIYRRIILSYGLMLVIAVSLLSSILFYLFSSSAAKEIDNNSKIVLAQTSYASEVIYGQVTNIGYQLLNDNKIVSFLYSTENDKIVNYNISIQLRKIQNIYPFIRSIGVYNLQSNLNITTEEIPIENSYLMNNKKKYIEFFPRKVVVEGVNNNLPNELITFILYPDFSLSKSSSSAIVINIDAKYILNTINSISGITHESSPFVIDSKGIILSHKDSSFFMKDTAKEAPIMRILEEGKSQGSFICDIGNKKNLVTYIKSDKMNWYFVSIKTYDQLIRNINQLRTITLFVAVLLITLGVIISVCLAGSIHNPIKSLIEKVSALSMSKDDSFKKFDEYEFLSSVFSKSQEATASMKSSMYRSSQLLKESYILSLLRGNLIDVKASSEVCENIEVSLTAPYYCMFLFKIDNYRNLKQSTTPKDQSLIRFAISNIAQELLSIHFSNETVIPEEDEVAILAQLKSNKVSEEIFLTLAEIQDALKNYFKISVSICIGDIVPSINEIANSYKTLQEYGKYRLFYGFECILDSSRVNPQASKSSPYPYTLEKKMIDALQLCNVKLVKKHIEEFIQVISGSNYFEAINYSSHLILSIFKHFDGIIDMQNENFRTYFNSISQIAGSETIDDISKEITGVCSKICIALDEKNSHSNTQKHKKIIDDVKTYVQENYSNPNLSLELVSDFVELSPGYLGKLFKNITAMTFNDYLNSVRLEKAKNLLSTSSEPASRICEKVGIFNITYFSTLFKKTYGMTPSQYRGQVSGDMPKHP